MEMKNKRIDFYEIRLHLKEKNRLLLETHLKFPKSSQFTLNISEVGLSSKK